MLQVSSPFILIFVLLQGSPIVQPPTAAACEDVRRIDLSLSPTAAAREICVSPGLTTSFRFNAPVVVELQDEVRFADVIRGYQLITLVPPPDMMSGERLRLNVRFEGGALQQPITFTLVAHSGRATHQVEVYRDQRTQEAYLHEVEQERMRNQKLREENQQLRVQLERAGGLWRLYIQEALGGEGVKSKELGRMLFEDAEKVVSSFRAVSYRSEKSVAVVVWVMNSGAEPWTVEGASLVSSTGEKLEGIMLARVEAIPPHEMREVFVEADATPKQQPGYVTLNLWDVRARTISIPSLTFP